MRKHRKITFMEFGARRPHVRIKDKTPETVKRQIEMLLNTKNYIMLNRPELYPAYMVAQAREKSHGLERIKK